MPSSCHSPVFMTTVTVALSLRRGILTDCESGQAANTKTEARRPRECLSGHAEAKEKGGAAEMCIFGSHTGEDDTLWFVV